MNLIERIVSKIIDFFQDPTGSRKRAFEKDYKRFLAELKELSNKHHEALLKGDYDECKRLVRAMELVDKPIF